jgi:predicted RNA-binding Zn ribbon-like protein
MDGVGWCQHRCSITAVLTDDLELVEAFLNTVDERAFGRHRQTHVADEALAGSQELSLWVAAHGLVDGPMPFDEADVAATIELRSALRASLTSELSGDSSALSSFPLTLAVRPTGGLRLVGHSGRSWLDIIVQTVVRSVARGDWWRMKLCAATDCRWAFHDTSRNGRGRWCDMDVCGNRQKTRTYRERQHLAEDRRTGD